MKQTIQSNFAEKIKELNEKEFIKIKLMLNTQSNNNQIRLNNQQKIAIANNIDNLKNQYQKQQEIIEKKTQQHLDSLYKLNKAQAEQRKEMVQIEFNKNQQLFQQDILAAKDRQLAADHVINELVDLGISDGDLQALAADRIMNNSISEHLDIEESEEDFDE